MLRSCVLVGDLPSILLPYYPAFITSLLALFKYQSPFSCHDVAYLKIMDIPSFHPPPLADPTGRIATLPFASSSPATPLILSAQALVSFFRPVRVDTPERHLLSVFSRTF